MKKVLYVVCALLLSIVLLASLSMRAQNEQKKTFPAAPSEAKGAALFAGTWRGVYKSNLVPPTTVTLIFQQRGTTVTGTYLSANGAQGVMSGTSVSHQPSSLSADQTTPTCTAKFAMAATVHGNKMQWTFKGNDCLGMEDGAGTATRVEAKR